ncbi:class C beta-lactamase [Stutzerimonas marianensis]
MRYRSSHYLTRLLTAAIVAWAGLADAASLAEQDARVRGAIEEVMQAHGIPGMAVALTIAGKQRFYELGVASEQTGEAVDRETLFELGSVSKTLTATLATYAQATGKLSLADSPGRYVPELAGSALDQVSLINLATHTAGGFPLQLPDTVRDESQLIAYFNEWTPRYAPGTQRTYANPSIGLLGRVAARSLDLPYAVALEHELLPRLGMTRTYLKVPAQEAPHYAQGYDKAGKAVRLNPAMLADEAYGVKSGTSDLLRFVEAHLGLVDIEGAVAQAITATRIGYYQTGSMTQDLVWEQYPYPPSLQQLQAGNSSQMVLDTHPVKAIVPPLPPQSDVWINKTGSTNGFGAYLAFVPARQQGIVILANRYYPNEARVALAYRILSVIEEDQAQD